MVIFIGWLALSFVAGAIASNKGRSGVGFFFLSVVLSPLIGILAAAFAKPNTAELEQRELEAGDHRKCPYCAELVRMEAKVCKHCGRDLPDVDKVNIQVPASPQMSPAAAKFMLVSIAVFAIIMLMVALNQ